MEESQSSARARAASLIGIPMYSPSSGPPTRSSRSSSRTGAHWPERSICAAAGIAAAIVATTATAIHGATIRKSFNFMLFLALGWPYFYRLEHKKGTLSGIKRLKQTVQKPIRQFLTLPPSKDQLLNSPNPRRRLRAERRVPVQLPGHVSQRTENAAPKADRLGHLNSTRATPFALQERNRPERSPRWKPASWDCAGRRPRRRLRLS